MIQSAGADHVEVVFDDDQRVAGGYQPATRLQQARHILEVQAGGGLVEQEQGVRGGGGLAFARALGGGVFRQVARELQALRFAARQRRHRLAERR